MRKTPLIITIIIFLGFIIASILLVTDNNENNYNALNSSLAIMVQNESDNNLYDIWKNETWPDESQYQLNTTKSKCNNTENVADILLYNDNNVSINANKTYKCNLYFDKKSQEPLEIIGINYITNYKMGNNNNAESTIDFIVNVKGGKAPYRYSYEGTYTCSEAEDLQKYFVVSNDNKFSFKLPFINLHTYTLKFTVMDANNKTATYNYSISPNGCFKSSSDGNIPSSGAVCVQISPFIPDPGEAVDPAD